MKKYATHYDPYIDPEDGPPEVAMCGTILGEECSLSGNWKKVTCKRCLARKVAIDMEVKTMEEKIVMDMGQMASMWVCS